MTAIFSPRGFLRWSVLSVTRSVLGGTADMIQRPSVRPGSRRFLARWGDILLRAERKVNARAGIRCWVLGVRAEHPTPTPNTDHRIPRPEYNTLHARPTASKPSPGCGEAPGTPL